MYNNNYHDESRHERLKVLFLTTILLFSTITNIFSISSFYSNFGFLKEVDALTTKESGSANIEKEVINCNNLNLNVNSRLTDNNNIDGQIFNPSREDKTEINADNNKYSNFKYNSKDNSRTVICKNLNVNEIYNQQEQPIDITETLTVIKNIRCEADTETCQQIQIQPSQFNVVIEGKNPSQNNFPGSSIGTNVELEEGRYSVSEEGLDPVTPELCNTMSFEAGQVASELGENLFICTNFSEECEGNITVGNPQTCTIENVIVEQKIIGNNVYIVWSNDDNGQVNIFFSASTDNGQTFSTPIDVSKNIPFSFDPYILVSGNNVYIAWSGESGGDLGVFFSVSTDNGQTFSTPIDVSNNDGRSITPIQLIVSENNIYIVWTDTSNGGDFDVFFSASTDNGQTFSTPIDVSSDTGFSYFGQMIVQ